VGVWTIKINDTLDLAGDEDVASAANFTIVAFVCAF
jgi:hypothetical protein